MISRFKMQRGIAVIHDMIVLDKLVIIGTCFGEYCSKYTKGLIWLLPKCIFATSRIKTFWGKGPVHALNSVYSFWAVLVPGLSDNALVTSFFVL